MSEWLKVPISKIGRAQKALVGSNPTLSATSPTKVLGIKSFPAMYELFPSLPLLFIRWNERGQAGLSWVPPTDRVRRCMTVGDQNDRNGERAASANARLDRAAATADFGSIKGQSQCWTFDDGGPAGR